MPKIPLYQQQSQIGTAKGVTIDPSVAVNLAEAESAAEQAVTNGIFNIMQETLGAGKEYLEKREESKRKADQHKFALWQKSELPQKIEQLKTKAFSEGIDASGAFGLKVNPYLDTAFEDWAKENNVKITRELKEQWELNKADIQNREILGVNKIQTEQDRDTGLALAYDLFKSEQFEEGRAIIDGLDLDPEQKRQYKSRGMYDYYAFKMDTAESLNQIENIVKQFESDDNLSFASESSLKRLSQASKKNFFATKASPSAKTADALLKDNELTEDWINESDMSEESKAYYKDAIKTRERLIRKNTFVNINTDKVTTVDGKQIGIGMETSGYLDDIVADRIDRLLTGDTKDFSKDLKTVYDILNSVDSDGTAYFAPSLKQKLLSPLMNVMADESRNSIFVKDAVPNTYNDVEITALRVFRETFSQIKGLTATEEIEGFADAFVMVNEFLDGIRKNEGVTVIKEDGKERFYNYKDDVYDAIDKALAPYRVKVAQSLRESYYKEQQQFSTMVQESMLAPVFAVTGDETYQSDADIIDNFGEPDDLLKPKKPEPKPVKITKIPTPTTKEEKEDDNARIAIQQAERKAEEARGRTGRFGIL